MLALFVANAIPLILLAFSGVNPNIFFGEGAIEAPKALRRVESTGKGSGKGARPTPQKFVLILDLKMAICGAFLVQFFAVQLKL